MHIKIFNINVGHFLNKQESRLFKLAPQTGAFVKTPVLIGKNQFIKTLGIGGHEFCYFLGFFRHGTVLGIFSHDRNLLCFFFQQLNVFFQPVQILFVQGRKEVFLFNTALLHQCLYLGSLVCNGHIYVHEGIEICRCVFNGNMIDEHHANKQQQNNTESANQLCYHLKVVKHLHLSYSFPFTLIRIHQNHRSKRGLENLINILRFTDTPPSQDLQSFFLDCQDKIYAKVSYPSLT